MPIQIMLPLTKNLAAGLCAGDEVLLSGVIYTARDAAHKRLFELIERGKSPPFPLDGAVIYYAGPTAPPPGRVTGSIGPTTSSRMDLYTPLLLRHGLAGMIGKGVRSDTVISAMRETGTVYFAATGGAGAYLSKRVVRSEVVAFPELGTEAVRRLEVCDFPAVTAIDSRGSSLYDTGRTAYLESVRNG